VSRVRRRLILTAVQVAVVAAFLVAWQFLPDISFLSSRFHWLDPFFISSPDHVARKVYDISVGHGPITVWRYAWETISSALLGTVIGMAAGGIVGLLLSNSRFLSDVFQPIVVALNAVPRIALIPVVVIILGPTSQASVAIAVMVVFFIAFYSAYEGGRTVSSNVMRNSILLGASKYQMARHLRLPYAFAWMMASLPLAATFALLSVVTGEILTGTAGMGQLITQALAFSDSALTFAVVIILSIVGIAVTGVATLIRRALLRWWDSTLT